MNVTVVGAGPGGLYLSILLRRGGHDVTVYERNPKGATYGWGVVFSAESLAELRDADYETYLAIDRALVRWDAIDIHHGGHLIRSVGHAFSAIARPELLRLLDERAAAVGVDVRYGFPVPVEALAGRGGGGGGGLLVGADGIHSVVRDAHRAGFATLSTPHSARYVWFGTDFALPTFTFVFRPADAGLFQAHAYPFSAGASTFIVECAEEVWRRAGLDRMDDAEALAHCEALFAPWLAGRRLLFKPSAGRPMWSAFTTIRNRSWHTRTVGGDAVVLLGDAAHTAHFSIGSGTRLALDDAIALAEAFAAHPDDEAAALAAYESERQPVVERFQEAATDSARYFESVGRLLSLPPTQFALNLLTRSGRITHLELTRRDPVLVNRCDRTYAGAGQSLLAPAPALVPLRLGGTVIANRMVLSPEATDAAAGGVPGPEARWALVEAAGFGAGLVVTEAVAPSPEGRVTSGSAGIWSEAQQRAWAGIVAEVQAAGALVALRLTHAGRRGGTRPRHRGLDRPLPAGQGWPLWGASAVPYAPHSRLPRPVDDAAMVELRRDYAAAAGRAAAAGFDLLLVDMSEGYLLAGFLSPLANRRSDAYGGDGRARFPLEVLESVASVWPSERPLGVRLAVDDRCPGGVSADEGTETAGLLAGGGAALVDVAAGYGSGGEASAPDYRPLFNVGLAERVRNQVGVAVACGGHITRIDEINTILAAGRADLCRIDPRRYLRNGGVS